MMAPPLVDNHVTYAHDVLIRTSAAGACRAAGPSSKRQTIPDPSDKADRLIHARAGMQYVPYHGSLLTMSNVSACPEEMVSESSSFRVLGPYEGNPRAHIYHRPASVWL